MDHHAQHAHHAQHIDPRHPSCPRCAYDLTGIVAAWTDACPTTGTCSECGLTFRWADLLDHRRGAPPLFFEHARHRLVLAFLKTLVMALQPWRFWRWIKMEHPFVKRRATAFLILALIFTELTTVALIAALMFTANLIITIRYGDTIPGPYLTDAVLGVRVYRYWPEELWTPALGALIGAAAAPLLLLTFTQSLKLSKIQPQHLVRILIYSCVNLTMVHLLFGLTAVVRITSGAVYEASIYGTANQADPWLVQAASHVRYWLERWGSFPCAFACVLLSCLYTHLAMTRYLRVTWAWRATAAITLIAFLAAFTTAVLLAPHQWALMFGWHR